MKARLVVVGGEAKTQEVELRLPTVIGRGRDATLTLPHPLVSRRHCEIYEENGQLLVRDLGSLNGTFIGKERITEAELADGALLTIGAVTFRAVLDALNGEPAVVAEGEETVSQRASATVRESAARTEAATDGEEEEQSLDKPQEASGGSTIGPQLPQPVQGDATPGNVAPGSDEAAPDFAPSTPPTAETQRPPELDVGDEVNSPVAAADDDDDDLQAFLKGLQ